MSPRMSIEGKEIWRLAVSMPWVVPIFLSRAEAIFKVFVVRPVSKDLEKSMKYPSQILSLLSCSRISHFRDLACASGIKIWSQRDTKKV